MGCCLLLKPPYRQAIGQKIDLLDVVRLLAVSVGRRCALPPEPLLLLFFFYTVMRTAAEDAVAVVILVEAGRLQN